MRLHLLVAALAFAVPAMAQTPPTGTSAPATSTQPTTAPTPSASLPSTPAQPSTPSTSRGGRRLSQAQRFEQANTTHDGKLTLDQARAAHMNAVARDFSAIDKDHKGYVTMADIRDHRRAVRAARKAAAAPKS